MRRLISIAAFALFLAVPLWAQHGVHAASGSHSFGGHSFGGHASGFAAHGFTGSRMRGSRFQAGARSSFRPGTFRGPIIRNSFSRRFRDRGFFNNCFGFRCRTGSFDPWWGYDPWLWSDWSDMDSRYDADYHNNLAQADQMDQQSLMQQDLENQRLLRQEREDGDQDSYAPRVNVAPQPANDSASPVPTTVLVFRDEHKQEVQNYAIVGQMLWNFSPGRTQRIPLSSLNLTATEKANDERGVTFRLPGTNEGQ